MENWAYLVAAYTVAWVGVAVYVFLNVKKQNMLSVKIEDLEKLHTK